MTSAGERMDELESRLAFQDDLIENLNDVVARQDREIARLERRLVEVEARLEELTAPPAGAGESGGHEVPPHY
jgi:SlyX protein